MYYFLKTRVKKFGNAVHCLLIKLWSMQFPFPNQIPSSHSKGFQRVVQTCIWNLLINLKYEGHLIFLLFSRNVGVPAPSIDFMSSSFHKIERIFLGRWRLGVGDRYVAPAQGHGRSLHSLSSHWEGGLSGHLAKFLIWDTCSSKQVWQRLNWWLHVTQYFLLWSTRSVE